MTFLGVDPSINNVGIAWYNDVTKQLITHQFHPPRKNGETKVEIANSVARCIYFFLIPLKKPDYVVLEYPNFQNSERGNIAAQKGYMIDLGFEVGVIVGSLALASKKVFTPTPTEWKGNLPKDEVGRRFKKRFGIYKDTISDHEFEAAMMIAWVIDEKLKLTPDKRK